MPSVGGRASHAVQWGMIACALAATPALGQATGQSTGTPDTSTAHHAATDAAPPAARLGVISGLVVDSLHGGGLVGAQISVEGVNSQAVTDLTGRFRIDSLPPGKYRVGVFHPLLDSLELSLASPELTVAADSTLSLIFATPSAHTYLRLTCGTTAPDTLAGVGPAELVGRALDAETERPVAHVRVTVSWTDIQASQAIGVRRTPRARDTTTGPNGEFRFCHLPIDFSGVVRAVNVAANSSVVSRPVAMGGRLVTFIALHVPSADTTADAGAGARADHATPGSARSGGSVLSGHVVRPEGAGPLAGAQVSVTGTTATAVTGDSGQFTLRGLPTGTRTLQVRALGWEPVSMSVELTLREPVHVNVLLVVKTAVLQAVLVTAAANAGLHRVGFDGRKQTGIGHFLTPDQLANRVATETLDLLTGVPGLTRRVDRIGENYLSPTRGTGGCIAYFVDGTSYQENRPGDINNYLQPQDIGAIEVYQPSEAPPQYAYSPPPIASPTIQRPTLVGAVGAGSARGNTSCMKILIWTKARLGI